MSKEVETGFFECFPYDSFTAIKLIADELDLLKTPKISKQLYDCLEHFRHTSIIIDISKVTYIDSFGIHFLASLKRKINNRARDMIIICTSEDVLEVFNILSMQKYFAIYNSYDHIRQPLSLIS